MDVVDLLHHRLVRVDGLRMVAFLPELPGAARLVRGLASGEEVEQPGAPLGGELGEQLAGGEFLLLARPPTSLFPSASSVGHDAREIGGMHDGVEVILQDDPPRWRKGLGRQVGGRAA